MNESKPAVPGAGEFEPEFVAGLKKMFEEQIVFNRVLGLKITACGRARAGRASRCGPS